LSDQELRVTSDGFLARVERLQALEEQKREVLEWAARQTTLAKDAAAEDGDGQPIAVTPPRALRVVLDEWRAAERAVTSEQPGTAAYESARADVDRLRDEYARAYGARPKD
jgi:hypothetical protein